MTGVYPVGFVAGGWAGSAASAGRSPSSKAPPAIAPVTIRLRLVMMGVVMMRLRGFLVSGLCRGLGGRHLERAADGALEFDPCQPVVAQGFDRLPRGIHLVAFGFEQLEHADEHAVVEKLRFGNDP